MIYGFLVASNLDENVPWGGGDPRRVTEQAL